MVTFVMGCSHPGEEVLKGKWQYDLESMRQVADQEEASPATIGYMEGLLQPMRQSVFDFQADGTLKREISGEQVLGTWALSSNGKKLTLGFEDTEMVYDVLQLSGKEIRLRPTAPGQGPVFTRIFVPSE